MFERSPLKPYFPALATLAGAALLMAAWPLASKLPWQRQGLVHGVGAALWAIATMCILWHYARKPGPNRRKFHIVAVLLLFVISVVPSQSSRFLGLTAQSLSMAGAFLLVCGLLHWQRIHPLLARLYRAFRRLHSTPSGVFICLFYYLFLAAALFISWYCFELRPIYTDSNAQYVHAKFVASGYLYRAPSHSLHQFFPVWLMINGPQWWYSQYPPMHQTLLGIMMYLKAPWLLNPLQGAMTLLLIYGICRHAYNEATARLAVLLTLLCQFVLVMSGEFMNHSSALFFATLMIFCYLRMMTAVSAGTVKAACRWGLAVGLAAGCGFLSRPLTAVGIALPFVVHTLYCLYRQRSLYLGPAIYMAAAGLFCVALQLWYNYCTTDDPWMFAYSRYHRNSLAGAMGYHKDGSLFKTLLKIHGDWTLLNVMLYEWSLPCSFFAMLVCLLPMRDLTTRLLVAVVVSHTVVNMFNQFYSTIFGPRYMYETSSAMIILTALGIRRLPGLMKLHAKLYLSPDTLRGASLAILVLIMATGITTRLPNNIRNYSRYMDGRIPVYDQAMEQTLKPALVFLGRGDKQDPTGKFRAVSWSMPPQDEDPIIFAYDRGDKENRKLIDYYPARRAYVETGGKLEPVVAP